MAPRIAIVTNADWYFWSHRLPVARAIRDAGCEVLVVAGEERGYGRRIEAEGFRFIPLPMVRGSTRIADDLKTLHRLIAIYRSERPQLVHHVAVKAVIYGSIAARVVGLPAVINALAGQGFLGSVSGPRGVMLRLAARLAYGVAFGGRRSRAIFQNPEDLGFFVRAGLVEPGAAVVIRGSGVDLERFSPVPEPLGTPTIVFASRLLWSKGLGDVVEAKRGLDAEGVVARLVIVGAPDTQNPQAVSERQLRNWEEEGVAEWWGLREDMPQVLSSANVVVLPSAYGEGVPKVLIEAAAVGRAIVTTDIPGCREVVRNGVNGRMVPPKNPVALAAALRELILTPAVRARMGEAGRAIAVEEFGERGIVAKTLEVYHDLLGSQWPG